MREAERIQSLARFSVVAAPQSLSGDARQRKGQAETRVKGRGLVCTWLSSAEQRERRQMTQDRQARRGLWGSPVPGWLPALLRMEDNRPGSVPLLVHSGSRSREEEDRRNHAWVSTVPVLVARPQKEVVGMGREVTEFKEI